MPAGVTANHPAVLKLKHWRYSPEGAIDFVRENFQIEPDDWQKVALRWLSNRGKAPKDQRLTMQACAGPGKSFVIAAGGWWFEACNGDVGKHPKGAVFSCDADNLRDNLWAEFGKLRQRSPFLKAAFEYTRERIFNRQYPEDWFLSARTFPKKANPDEIGRTLSGLHGPYVFIGGDETANIPVSMLKTSEQAMSNVEFAKFLQAGNPISLDGMLYEAAVNQRERWTVIEITGDPDDPTRSPRVDIEWARNQIALYGRDNPWVKAYVLGRFPPASINTLLSVDEVREAMKRTAPEHSWNWAQKRCGVDVARFGDDRTVIFKRQGLMSWPPHVLRNEDTMAIADRIGMIRREWNTELDLVDDTGHWGHGVIDKLRTMGHNPLAVIFHAKPGEERFGTKRDEMWLKMADWVKAGGCLPDVPELVAELTVPTYTFVGGKLKVEDKDQIKKRLQRSPDLADALACTFAIPDMPSQFDQAGRQIVRARGAGKQPMSYDVYGDGTTHD